MEKKKATTGEDLTKKKMPEPLLVASLTSPTTSLLPT
jgi:hypothetical protein